MRRLIWLPVAGFLLIAGAAVATAAPTVLDRAQAALQGATATDPASTPAPTDPGATAAPDQPHGSLGIKGAAAQDILNEVLAKLVADGTITQAQADAITNGVKDKLAERQATLQELRKQWQETATKLKTFLEDGVITSDELAQLPADNPIANFEDILADGQITQEELDSVMVGPHFMRGPGGPGHFHIQRVPPSTDTAPDDSGTGTSTDS